MSTSTDLRVVKTRRALISTMVLMLREVPFGKITVNDICLKALVSRSAFYAHFQDKYDLLTQSLDAISQQLFAVSAHQGVEAQIRAILHSIQRDDRLFKNLLMADYDAELMELLRKGFLARFFQHQEEADSELAFPHPQEISVTCCAAGFTSAIILWIRGNMQYTADEMFACIWALMPKNGRS